MKETHTRVLFILLVGISMLAQCGSLTQGYGWDGDSAGYIMQAQSITQGALDAFVDANRITIEQSSIPLGPIAYPWGFPMLLAPLYALFGLNPLALKTVGVLSYLLFLLVLWRAFRRTHSAPWFLCLVSLFALNPTLLGYSNHITSDLPFLLFSTLCVVLIREVVVEDRRIVSRLLDLVLIGAGIACASLIRTNGILLLITLGVSQLVLLFQKRAKRRQPSSAGEGHGGSANESGFPRPVSIKTVALQAVPYVVFFTVAAWNYILPDGGMSHVSQLGSISAGTIVYHLRYYLVLPAAFLAGVPYHLNLLLYGLSIPLAIAGAVRRYRSDYPAMIYVVLTLLLYVFWPSVQGIRFLFPILPFYFSLVFSGLEALCDCAPAVDKRLWKALCYLPVVAVILRFGSHAGSTVYRNINDGEVMDGPFAATSQELFSFIADHTESDSTIIFFKPRVMRLMTGRQSISVDAVEQILRGDYLCIYLRANAYNQLTESEVECLLAQGIIHSIYANSDFALYRLMKGTEELRPLPSSLGFSLASSLAVKGALANQLTHSCACLRLQPSALSCSSSSVFRRSLTVLKSASCWASERS